MDSHFIAAPRSLPLILLLGSIISPLAQESLGQEKSAVDAAVAKAQTRMKDFKMPKGMKADLWADTSQIKNPSAICFDSKGNLYLAEVNRWGAGISAITGKMFMVWDDIQLTSNEERLAMYTKHSAKQPMDWYTATSDTIKVLADTDNDGKADSVKIYADGFNNALDGPGIGLIERDGKIYYANVPHIWMLEDHDGDGMSDQRTSLQDGFGLRLSYAGHDVHGLIWGPDGKLYWSMGDRGYNVKTKEGKQFLGPNEGGVFRCDPDGSNVELFYKRLRNPQELQFDEFGNLFTADNDGDGSDLERINYIVEGGDSGWTAGHQALMSFTSTFKFRSNKYLKKKPFNSWELERMWKVRNQDQPQYILPGIGQINGGPSGFLYNPSSSMGEKYRKKFFVIHYKGSIARSYISTFNTIPTGAGFKTENHEEFFKGSNNVDIEFGPDGKLYITEFNYAGWQKQDVGNIYTLYFPEEIKKPSVEENKKILLSNFTGFSLAKLEELLAWDHQTIRQKAQFELAKRGPEGLSVFKKSLTDDESPLLKRVHAVWGMGQMIKQSPSRAEILFPFITDKQDQVRIQVARVLGDHQVNESAPLLVKALKDKNAQVQMYAAIGLGRMKFDAVDEVVLLLRANADQDLFLRHGLVMALQGLDQSAFFKYRDDPSESVRLGILLALKMKNDSGVAYFLNDPSKMVRDEAITVINDIPIISATSALAEELDKYTADKTFEVPTKDTDKFIHHRIINAALNSGRAQDATRLLRYAANKKIGERERLEALAAIEAWHDNHPLDSTTGRPRTQGERSDIQSVVSKELGPILQSSDGKIQAASIRIAVKNSYEIDEKLLYKYLNDPGADSNIRLEALKILAANKDPKLLTSINKLMNDKSAPLRSAARKILLEIKPDDAIKLLLTVVRQGSDEDKRDAWNLLSGQTHDSVKLAFLTELEKIKHGGAVKTLLFDILQAGKRSKIKEVAAQFSQYDTSLQSKKLAERYQAVLHGGDLARGRDIFMNNGVAQCVRCHKVNNVGGEVGPDLSRIGKENGRIYLLESLLDPSAKLARGFGVSTLKLKDGKELQGVIMDQTDSETTLKLSDDTSMKIKAGEIASVTNPPSSMPPMRQLLNDSQLRDLVEYLSQQIK